MENGKDWLSRTQLLIGANGLKTLEMSDVLIVGLGGVGAYAAEMLCRAGIGKMTIVDGDRINPTNRNRQLIALTVNDGLSKASEMAKRLLTINPDLELNVIDEFIRDERMVSVLSKGYDYVVDAIDTLSPKCYLIVHCLKMGINVVSSMGAGGKTDPSKVEVCDISKSYNDRLAYALRKRLHRNGIRNGFKVIFSSEKVDQNSVVFTENEENKLTTVGTISYMPPLFGIMCASVVIRDLLSESIVSDKCI